MSLDLRVAQAVMAAKLMERALHDPGPWHIEWDGVTAPATKVVSEDVVSFHATFGGPLHAGPATLYCRGEVQSYRAVVMSLRDHAVFTLVWEFAAEVVSV
jgi:hypothetical protein